MEDPVDEEIIEGARLLQLPDRHRWRRDTPRPNGRRGGRFIPAAFVRLHDEADLLWFPVRNQHLEPNELSA